MTAAAFKLRNRAVVKISDLAGLREWVRVASGVVGKGNAGDSAPFRKWLIAKAAEMNARSVIPADWSPGGGIVTKAELYETLAKSVTDRDMQAGYRELAETAKSRTMVIKDREPGGQRLRINGRFDVVRDVAAAPLANRGELLAKAAEYDRWAGRAMDGETARLCVARARQLRTEAAAS